MDQRESMFTKKVDQAQRKTQSKNLNLLLDYTEDGFRCGNENYNWTYDTLYLFYLDGGNEFCWLKDGTKITTEELAILILTDHSFKLREDTTVGPVLANFFSSLFL